MKAMLGCFALSLALCAAAVAQELKADGSGTAEVVAHIQHSVQSTLSSLPDFLCEERAVSRVLSGGKVTQEVRLDSTVRGLRQSSETGNNVFLESREPRSSLVNSPHLPFALYGGFARSLVELFTPDSSRCLDFKLEGTRKLKGIEVLLLTARTKDKAARLGGVCGFHTPDARSEIWIDPAEMQVVRIERKPIHSRQSPAIGVAGWPEDVLFSWSVDFSRVLIEAKPYWMPTRVRAEASSTTRPRSMTYQAEYSKYHKFSVQSKILLDSAPDK